MSTEDNKKTAMRFTNEAWNQGNLAVLDEVCDPSYRIEGFGGLAELKQGMVEMGRAFPDARFTVEEIIAEGDAVATRWTWSGTHLGPYQDIAPTGKHLTQAGMTIFHFAGGKIIHDRYESSSPDTRQALLEP